MIEEIAIGVIGSDYKDYIFYESLDAFMSQYSSDPILPDELHYPIESGDSGKVVKLRLTRKLFIPPEARPESDVEDAPD